jgi:hypothetical protein
VKIVPLITVKSPGKCTGQSSFTDGIYPGKQVGMPHPSLSDSFPENCYLPFMAVNIEERHIQFSLFHLYSSGTFVVIVAPRSTKMVRLLRLHLAAAVSS